MKYNAFILTLVLLLFSCSSPERKAKKAIKQYFKFTLNDFKSYEPVSYGKIDYDFSSYETSPEYIKYLNKADKCNLIAEGYLSKSREYSDKNINRESDFLRKKEFEYYGLAVKALDSVKVYEYEMEKAKNSYEKEIIGWKMKHSFRARVPAGGYKLSEYEFYFDKKILIVIKAIDLSEQ